MLVSKITLFVSMLFTYLTIFCQERPSVKEIIVRTDTVYEKTNFEINNERESKMKIFVTNDTNVHNFRVPLIQTFERGFYSGLYMDFYESNLPKTKGNYLSTDEDGIWHFWGKDGIWYYWNKDGTLKKKETWRKGKIIKSIPY